MTAEHSSPDNDAIESTYAEHVMPIWKHLDVPVRRASGATLEDYEGEEYLDVFSGIPVTSAGHNNPAVVEALRSAVEAEVGGDA